MGCAQSKIENEETVTRCKERKFFMKEAVGERNAFAAAHSAYAMSLKNTGAALSDYAQGEVPFPSSISASVSSSSAAVPGPSSALPQQSYDFPPPPPLPPLPHFSPPSLQRSNTAPEMSFAKPDIKHEDTILEDEEETDTESVHELRHRSSKSSGGGGGVSTLYRQGPVVNEVFQQPPSPPPSRTPTPPLNHQEPPPPPPPEGNTYWDFFSSVSNVPGPALAESDVNSIQSEEIERKMMMDERIKRSEINGDGGRKSTEKMPMEEVVELPRQQEPPQTPKAVKKVKPVVPVEGKRKAPVNVNLLQMFNEIDDCFLKAYQSANEVSKMLEANRLHYHSNFADNRGHIDHSARVMRVITWNRSFRGLPQPADDPNDDFDSEENETHATVLDKMLAWEKKLYDEVKAGEQMKLEYQRKVASLNKLKKRGTNTDALERMKAAVSHLHTRYIVDMQSMDSTVSEINRLRDEQLYPKLVALVEGMATMWENMSLHHQNQFKIVHALRSLDISQCTKETTDHHNGRTYQLHEVIKEWHTQCEKLMNHQKKYISALNHWLKLNLIPIDTNLREKVSSPQRPQTPAIQPLLLAWHDYLEKLPDELARTAIYNFSAVIHTIMEHQMDEIKLRDGCSETRKELERKTRQFEDWYRKRLQKKTPNEDETEADKELEKEQVDEKVFQLEVIKKRLEEEEEVYRKLCLQVREKSLTSLRQRLPELFRAMSDFSAACSDMYGHLRNISQMHNRSEGS